METTQGSFTQAAILGRVIAPNQGTLPKPAAQAFLAFEFAQDDLDRMNELAEKNRRGIATADELAELEEYSRIGGMLNLLQAKARRSLADG